MLTSKPIRHVLRAARARQGYRHSLRYQHDFAARNRTAGRPGILAFVVFGGAAYGAGYYLNRKPESNSGRQSLAQTLESATALIRAGEEVHAFGNPRSTGSHVHSTLIPSNSPVEDRRAADDKQDRWQFWGVYDGHAGYSTAEFLANNLIPNVKDALDKLPDSALPATIDSSIKTAFTDLDASILDPAAATITHASPEDRAVSIQSIAPALSGSCALLAIYSPADQQLRVACVGDSRAVLGRCHASTDTKPSTVTAVPLSEDQTGFNTSEKTRIEAEHPGESPVDPQTGRTLGLAVSRAFGDSRWKWSTALQKAAHQKYWGFDTRPGALTPPYLTAEPVVTTTKVEPGEFLILASDGLWDHMSSEDAVACVAQWRETRRQGKLQQNWQQRDEEKSEEKVFEHTWKGTPEFFVFEDDNAATCLAKNSLGGSRRGLFRGLMSLPSPQSRDARDDITVQVIFFE